MAEACELLTVELALDRIAAELARELPAHVRAFAIAHTTAAPPPPAPAILHRAGTLASVLAACTHPVLADRGLALLRLIAPLLVEGTPAVAAARAVRPSWPAYAVLRAARDAAARDRFAIGALELAHLLHGVSGSRTVDVPAAAPVAGWAEPDVTLDDREIRDAWSTLATRFGVRGAACTIVPASARARAFIVEPGREVIVVIPRTVATPADRFAVLHELGHAIAALAVPHELARVVDEAAASHVARLMETPGVLLESRWGSPLATAARARRRALAAQLAAIEHGADGTTLAATPPWALWHDPGAQAAYVEAEEVADRLAGDPGTLAARLVAEHARCDQAATRIR